MVSRRIFSFKWRLFIPMVVLVWVIIGTMMAYQYHREDTYRRDNLRQQLNLVSTRIFWAYENDQDLRPFLNFIGQYFDNSIFDELSITIYDRHGALLYTIGTPVAIEKFDGDIDKIYNMAKRHELTPEMFNHTSPYFFFSASRSNDGEIYVLTAMPYTMTISDALGSSIWFWVIVLSLSLVASLLIYIYIRYLTRGVKILYNFATMAADDNVTNEAVSRVRFPHNELGEIARKIVTLFMAKDSALRRLDREHKIALHAVDEKAAIKRRLTNNINHELKTPVGIVRGYLETIVTNPDLDPALRDRFISKAFDKINDLCTLLRDVSTMTRLEDGSGSIPLSEVNFHDTVFAIDDELTQAGIIGTMTFHYNLPYDCVVRANPQLLSGAITNLIRNAAIHSGGTEIHLNLVAESKRFYSFAFYDNGQGVEESHLPHLFERFYRVDSGRSRKAGGTGLGLPIVKNTIEALGGSISVHNRAKGGLEFIFTLEKYIEPEEKEDAE